MQLMKGSTKCPVRSPLEEKPEPTEVVHFWADWTSYKERVKVGVKSLPRQPNFFDLSDYVGSLISTELIKVDTLTIVASTDHSSYREFVFPREEGLLYLRQIWEAHEWRTPPIVGNLWLRQIYDEQPEWVGQVSGEKDNV